MDTTFAPTSAVTNSMPEAFSCGCDVCVAAQDEFCEQWSQDARREFEEWDNEVLPDVPFGEWLMGE